MKSIQILIYALILTVTVSCMKKDPKSEKEKVSYAIGQQIGGNLKSQSVDIDVKMLAQSIEEAVAGKKGRMTEKEMFETMRALQKRKVDERKKEGESSKKVGADFLEANKKKDGVKVTDSGLQYEVVKEGKGDKPKATDVVEVHYKGTFIDGKEFDSSYKRDKPAKFPVKGVIKGWTEALQMMPVGSKWRLVIPSDIAYGSHGNSSIPPNSVLVFEVELLNIVKEDKKEEKK